jgi:hypothetical protein
MTFKRAAFVSIAAACATSLIYVFITGVSWDFVVRSGSLPSAIFTALVVSAWACVPYLILLPIAQREGSPLFAIFTVLGILGFGLYSMESGRHEPGDEGGSYIVVAFQQVLSAIVILAGWWGVRRALRQ